MHVSVAQLSYSTMCVCISKHVIHKYIHKYMQSLFINQRSKNIFFLNLWKSVFPHHSIINSNISIMYQRKYIISSMTSDISIPTSNTHAHVHACTHMLHISASEVSWYSFHSHLLLGNALGLKSSVMLTLACCYSDHGEFSSSVR